MKQPSKATQQQLLNIDRNIGDEITITRSKDKYRIKWLRPYTTNIYTTSCLDADVPKDVSDKDLAKYAAKKYKLTYKLASYVILNNIWTIKFFHWAHWRWLMWFKQYDNEQLHDIIDEGKKKIDVQNYYLNMVWSIQMMDTMMTLTKKETGQFLQELTLAQNTPSGTNIPTS